MGMKGFWYYWGCLHRWLSNWEQRGVYTEEKEMTIKNLTLVRKHWGSCLELKSLSIKKSKIFIKNEFYLFLILLTTYNQFPQKEREWEKERVKEKLRLILLGYVTLPCQRGAENLAWQSVRPSVKMWWLFTLYGALFKYSDQSTVWILRSKWAIHEYIWAKRFF